MTGRAVAALCILTICLAGCQAAYKPDVAVGSHTPDQYKVDRKTCNKALYDEYLAGYRIDYVGGLFAVLGGAAAGVAAGGGTGAARSAMIGGMMGQSDPTNWDEYEKNYVRQCMAEKGYTVTN